MNPNDHTSQGSSLCRVLHSGGLSLGLLAPLSPFAASAPAASATATSITDPFLSVIVFDRSPDTPSRGLALRHRWIDELGLALLPLAARHQARS